MEMVLAQEELSSAQPLERQQPQQHQRSMQQLPMQQRSMQQHAMQQHPMQQQQQQEHQTQRAVVPAYTPPPLLSAQPLGWQEQQQQRSMQQFPMQHHPGQHHPMQLHQQQQQHQTQRPLVRAPPSQPHGPTTGDANVESRGARLTDVVDTPTASNLAVAAQSVKSGFQDSRSEEDTPATESPIDVDDDLAIKETYIPSGTTTDEDDEFSLHTVRPALHLPSERSEVPLQATSGVSSAATASTPPRASGPQRTSPPHYPAWKIVDLKKEAARLSKREGGRDGLRFNGLDILNSPSNASKSKLVHALVARMAWREANQMPAEWKNTATGITPVKKGPALKAKVSKPSTPGAFTPKQDFHCLLLCAMNDTRLWELYVKSRNAPSRDEQDRKALGWKGDFVREMAKAMSNPDWVGSDGNGFSLPDDHKGDTSAPLSLTSALAGLDLEATARALQEDLPRDEHGNPVFEPLMKRISFALKEIKAKHTVMQVNENQSGGEGADLIAEEDGGEGADLIAEEDGGDGTARHDARHSWNFCQGRLPTMIYADLMSLRGDESGIADAVIPDGGVGSISSVPGNTGTRSTTRPRGMDPPSTPGGGGSPSGRGPSPPEQEGSPPGGGGSPPEGGGSSPGGGGSPPGGGGGAPPGGGGSQPGGGSSGTATGKRKNKTPEYEAKKRRYEEDVKKRQDRSDRSDKIMESMEAARKIEEATSAKASETAAMEREEAQISLERARRIRDRDDSAEAERLMNDVIRLSGTLRGLGPDEESCVREACEELLEEAKDELKKATSKKKARKANN